MKARFLVIFVVLAVGYALARWIWAPSAPGTASAPQAGDAAILGAPAVDAPRAEAPPQAEGIPAGSGGPDTAGEGIAAPTGAPSPDPAGPRVDALALEKQIMTAKEITEAQALLEKAKISDFQAELKSAGRFSNRTDLLSALNGSHVGGAAVHMPDGDHNWEVRMSLNSSMTDGRLSGTLHVGLLQEGKTYANNDETGDVTSVLEYRDPSSAIILRVNPTLYFQLFYVGDTDQFVGNVYSRAPQDTSFAAVGKAWLKRN